MGDEAEKISMFMMLTNGSDENVARFYLSSAGGNMEAAMNAYFETGANPPPAAIPEVQVNNAAAEQTTDTSLAESCSWAESVFGTSGLLTKDGSTKPASELLAGKRVVAIYFSAHWCPPCRGFTPVLTRFYSAARSVGLEIVFASSDRDQRSFNEYYRSMPWLAIPFVNRALKTQLSGRFGVNGIPSLLLLDGATGREISRNGRASVMHGQSDPVTAVNNWAQQSASTRQLPTPVPPVASSTNRVNPSALAAALQLSMQSLGIPGSNPAAAQPTTTQTNEPQASVIDQSALEAALRTAIPSSTPAPANVDVHVPMETPVTHSETRAPSSVAVNPPVPPNQNDKKTPQEEGKEEDRTEEEKQQLKEAELAAAARATEEVAMRAANAIAAAKETEAHSQVAHIDRNILEGMLRSLPNVTIPPQGSGGPLNEAISRTSYSAPEVSRVELCRQRDEASLPMDSMNYSQNNVSIHDENLLTTEAEKNNTEEVLTKSNIDAITQFMQFTGADTEVAKQLLKSSGWSVSIAATKFYNSDS